MRRQRWMGIALLAGVFAARGACVNAAATFQGLGFLVPHYSSSSAASGVSADGSVVVGSSADSAGSGTRRPAFRWTQATGIVGLGYINNAGSESAASDVSNDGSIVVGGSTWHPIATIPQAFRWTSAG